MHASLGNIKNAQLLSPVTSVYFSFFSSDDMDLKHFDPEFTREAISDTPSPPKGGGMSISIQDDTFAGFSYIPTQQQQFS